MHILEHVLEYFLAVANLYINVCIIPKREDGIIG